MIQSERALLEDEKRAVNYANGLLISLQRTGMKTLTAVAKTRTLRTDSAGQSSGVGFWSLPSVGLGIVAVVKSSQME